MIGCMLIASRNDGKVPANPNYLKRILQLSRKPNLKPLFECGFFLETLADASTLQADARPEKRQRHIEQTEKRHIEQTYHVREEKYSDDFEYFWSIYPKNGATKKLAYKSFMKAIKSGVDSENIIRGVPAYVEYLTRTETSVAHATTWLNQSRWTVEHSAIPGKKPASRTTNHLAALYAAGNNIINKQQSRGMEPSGGYTKNAGQEGIVGSGEVSVTRPFDTIKH